MVNITDVQSSVTKSGNSLRGKATANKGDKLEKSDFMNLFMYQLANQNPLAPMDSDKMMSSLSQLGSMEQLQALNSKISDLAVTQKELLQFNALGLIGREVQVNDNNFEHQTGGNSSFIIKLDKNAQNVKANIINSTGQVVKQLELGAMSAGNVNISWDGKTTKNEDAAPGSYLIQAFAYNNKGEDIAANIIRNSPVTEIKMEKGRPLIKVGNQFIAIEDALSIK